MSLQLSLLASLLCGVASVAFGYAMQRFLARQPVGSFFDSEGFATAAALSITACIVTSFAFIAHAFTALIGDFMIAIPGAALVLLLMAVGGWSLVGPGARKTAAAPVQAAPAAI